jgi:hypothetical protein
VASPLAAAGLADQNYVASFREHVRWQEPCELREEEGLLLMAGCNAFPGLFRNCAVRVDPALEGDAAAGRAQDFFRARGRGFTFLARESCDGDLERALKARGFSLLADSPCMLIEAPVESRPVPPGLRLSRFESEREVEDAARVNAQAYEALKLPAAEARLYFNRPRGLLSERVTGFVAYRDALPVATALTIHSGGSAGVYWVGTVAPEQKKGLGELMTRLATNAGFERGASVVTLQASPFGEPVYRRLGYRVYYRSRRYRPG